MELAWPMVRLQLLLIIGGCPAFILATCQLAVTVKVNMLTHQGTLGLRKFSHLQDHLHAYSAMCEWASHRARELRQEKIVSENHLFRARGHIFFPNSKFDAHVITPESDL